MSDELHTLITQTLPTRWLGREIIYLQSTASTNDVAREAAVNDKPEGLVVLAEQQTQGRGRQGRAWLAPPGSSILMSILLRPSFPPSQVFSLTMLTGSAVSSSIERITGLRCGLKWPNDLLFGNKKVGGILTEASLCADGIDSAVVGLGLNVNVDFAAEPTLAEIATSLSTQLGREVARGALIGSILEEIENRYEAVQRGDYLTIFEEWRGRLTTLGKEVIITDGRRRETGLAHDVDAEGTLLLKRNDGSVLRVITGDVSLREAK